MGDTLKERSELSPEYMWDLSTLFESDEAFEKELGAVSDDIAKIKSFEGTLNTAENVRSYFDFETALGERLSNLFCYANLRRSEDTRAEDAQSMYLRVYGVYVGAISEMAFSEPEILAQDKEKLEEWKESKVLSLYKYSIEKLIRHKEHTLSASEETLLARFGEVFGASAETADNLQDADMVFDSVRDGAGEDHEVTGSNYILHQMSPDRVLRENSFRSFYKGYRQHNNTFASTYGATVKGAAVEASVRHYGSSREMYMAGENIPVEVYDNLIATVRKYMPVMYRYVELRKKILGIEDLHYFDVYAPLADESKKSYSYEQAQQMVLDAIAPLGEDYVNIVRGAYRDNWIDVYPNKGKSGGAFSSGTYSSNPYILTNFTGTLDSVSTIAHEMGHSMHSYFSNHNQPAHLADYTIFVAEVASTVNENLLITGLLKECTDPHEKLSLLNQYLENFKGTVFRQTMFAEFEREAHAMAERGEAMTPAALNELYEGLVRDYFGDALVMDEEVAYEWSRIPHFYRPFYVYKYATSYCAAMAITEGILSEGQPAVDRYRKFLTLGGSMDPLDELKVAGVDLSIPDPIETALEKFEKVLAEAEETYDAICC